MNLQVAVCLPREAGTVSIVRSFLGRGLRVLGVAEECAQEIELAVSEACNNVIQHAGTDEDYEVRVDIDEEHCAISVVNSGPGFDAESLAGLMPDAASSRGRGVAVMRAVMDSLEFRSEPETGTIVRLVKNLSLDPDGLLARQVGLANRPAGG
jgi:serine/threonine-protein kinase RsbW